MEIFLSNILKTLKKLDIKPIIYGSFGASLYLGNFKEFGDIDILIEDNYIFDDWTEFRQIFESDGFILIDEKEHEFMFEDKKVGFAAKSILIRDRIINDYKELVQYKRMKASTLTVAGFIRAYEFSINDGYRINTRNKKDRDIIMKLKEVS